MFYRFAEKFILLVVTCLVFTSMYLTTPKSLVAYNTNNLKTVSQAVQEDTVKVVKQN